MKTARYFVGGYSDSSISYRRLKVEDAINAASEALDGGVVAGGGVALRGMGPAFSTGKESIGKKILSNALKVPFETILNNAGMVDENNRESSYVQDEGIDTRTNLGVNMFEEGIIDPKKVVLSAVKSAISVAASILTHGTVVLMPEQDPQAANPANLIMR
jgi:chaperonin GroEL